VTVTVTQRKRANSRHQPVGRWISKTRRLAIYMRDGFRCLICNADLSAVSAWHITLDHHVPRHLGGTNESRNLYTCCRDCNQEHKRKARPARLLRRIVASMNKEMTTYLDAATVLVRARERWYAAS
jgi:5-methylcytosine-specific restriction endonuclease McrA